MPDSIDVTGSGNFIASGVSNSTINASIVIGKSGEYRELEDKLNTLQKLFDRTRETEAQERLEISEKIERQKAFIESFKRDVLTLAETFERTELNTERLQKAKEHFDKGEITEARVLLEDAEEERSSFVTRALGKQKEYEENILPGLQNAATEYLILAQTTALDFENPNRFEDTCRYYEQSINAYAFPESLFKYTLLLQEHNQLHLVEPYYKRILNEFLDELSEENYIGTLNNLGELYRLSAKYEAAITQYSKALEISRDLATKRSDVALPIMAGILNNLAITHTTLNQFEMAEKENMEALAIYRRLAQRDPQVYLPHMATSLNNLAVLHNNLHKRKIAEKEHTEALEIRRELAKKSPHVYLSDVAVTLNNLAVLHCDLNDHEAAEREYSEALQIRRELAEKTPPQAYLPDLGNTLRNLAIFYQEFRTDKERSIALALEAVAVLVPFAEEIPAAETYLAGAIRVLKEWGMSEEEIIAAVSGEAGG